MINIKLVIKASEKQIKILQKYIELFHFVLLVFENVIFNNLDINAGMTFNAECKVINKMAQFNEPVKLPSTNVLNILSC